MTEHADPSEEKLEPARLPDEENGAVDETAADDTLRTLVARHFIEYASYVIKERAIPDVDDGLKPVQRRILHAMSTLDDGRFNKVANIVGNTMQYHPHGDASIFGALVVLANKEYFIDRQGNFGNILTGDEASAPRYIEARLSTLAKEVLFSRDITEFVDSYDGRNREPVCLPAKVPALLMLGADGIAVGMRTQIFPHNFRELLEAQIAILENRPFQIFPDFPQGGIMDVSEYADGAGKIRLRARIDADGDKKLVIREIPATTTTDALIASIDKAVKRGKLKISAINDYTASDVEIEINLARSVYAAEAIKELYAYTECETTVRSTLLVIQDNVPVELTVSQVLRRNTEKLQQTLQRELLLQLDKLEEKFHEKSLARIFIENRIYKRIESCETMEKIMAETRKGLEKFRAQLLRDILDADIEKLLQIAIRRISLFDLNKNQEELDTLLRDMEQVRHHLANLTAYTIATLRRFIDKYAVHFPRRTTIEDFEAVNARDIARKDIRIYHDKLTYFIGSAVKPSNKNDQPLVCTEFDRLMLLKNDGTCKVIQVTEKEYIGPTKYVFIADKDQVFSIIYRDRKEGTWYAKRFQLGQYILTREYQIIPENCLIEQLYTNDGVILKLELETSNRRSYNHVPVDFAALPMRSREARGFKLTSYPVTGITLLNRGTSDKTVQSDRDDANDAHDNPPPPATTPPATTPPATTPPATTPPATTPPATTPPATGVGAEAQHHPAIARPAVARPTLAPTGADAGVEKPGPAVAPPRKGKRVVDEDTPFFLE